MAWTELTRTQHTRKTKRYPSDLTPEEWAVVRPLLPTRKRLGRPRQVKLRRVWNGRLVWARADGMAWKPIRWQFGISRATANRRWQYGLAVIVWRLNGKRVPTRRSKAFVVSKTVPRPDGQL